MITEAVRKLSTSLRNTPVLASYCPSLTISGVLAKKRRGRWFSSDINEEKEEIVPVENIRNFCIIAHVDHGKSTLADRILEMTGVIQKSSENKQVLDRLPVEKERGITVKAVTASLPYIHNDTKYLLNLIDTPGHVDFSNEVSRSLYACQGVILLVDANQGVQAQTVANFYSAFAMELTIIPVLNKIDLPLADPESVEKDLEILFDFDKSSFLRISAKTGLGVENLLKTIVEKVPPPPVNRDEAFKALLIDSWYDKYRGVLLFTYVAGGSVRKGEEIMFCNGKKKHTVHSLGELTPDEKPVEALHAGQVGVIGCNVKVAAANLIGDTIHSPKEKVEPLKTFGDSKPMVFAGLYPKDQSHHSELKSAIERLSLNDASVTIALETSPALGLGWRLGFLGLLHLDVFRQRLEQEFAAEAVLTAPSVTYKVKIKKGKKTKEKGDGIVEIKNPVHFPEPSNTIEECYEPIVSVTIIAPDSYLQAIVDECLSRRAQEEGNTRLDGTRIVMKFTMPLSEIIYDFHDKLKSLSSGYASLDYEDKGYQVAPLKKLKIFLNGKEVEELTSVVHKERVRQDALKIVTKLQEMIPRQQVLVAIQAVVEGDVIVRRDIKPYRKDVTAKVYGGDPRRKMKLLSTQREGKTKMRKFLNIQIPRDTFVEVLRGK